MSIAISAPSSVAVECDAPGVVLELRVELLVEARPDRLGGTSAVGIEDEANLLDVVGPWIDRHAFSLSGKASRREALGALAAPGRGEPLDGTPLPTV
jgi:hypothetical protein